MPGPLTETSPSFLDSLNASADDMVSDPGGHLRRLVSQLMAPAARASQISRAQFPGQDWDLTQRNALRHSLWVGGMARAIGADPENPNWTPVATGLAKGAGYANEGISYLKRLVDGQPTDDPAYVNDTLHDLNANAVGALTAAQAPNDAAMVQSLIDAAMRARAGAPVGLLEPTDGQLSVDPSTPISRTPPPR